MAIVDCSVYVCLVLLALGAVAVRGQTDCARACLTAGFGADFDVIGEANSLSIQSSFGQASQLDDFCSKKDKVTSCLAACESAPDKFTHDILSGMMTYVCGPGRKVLLLERGCWQLEEYRQATKSCSLTMQTDLRKRIGLVKQGKAPIEAVCGTLDEFKNCMVMNVEELCGHRAADFVKNLFQPVIQPTRSFLNCPGGSRAKRGLLATLMRSRVNRNAVSSLQL